MAITDWEEFELYGTKLLSRTETPGAIVAVAVEGEPVYMKGFGFRDAKKTAAPDEETIFGIGSITKSFTALGIMQLQEQGKLQVTDLVTKHIPEFRFGKGGDEKGMTVHHLLTHTAGMPPLPSLNRTMVRSLLKDAERKEAPAGSLKQQKEEEKQLQQLAALEPIDNYDQFLDCMAGVETPLLGSPGEYFSYSNDSYALLGLVIERVSGETYEDYVKNHILEPLGMVHSSIGFWKTDNVATLYASKRIKGKDVLYPSPEFWDAPSMISAGFLRSTARDMLRYMEIYRTGGKIGKERILSEENIIRMTSPQYRMPNGYTYGYGLMVHPNYKGVSLVEHGGNVKGVSAQVACIPQKNITGVALTNYQNTPAPDLLLGAFNAVLGLPVSNRRFPAPRYEMPDTRLGCYAGTYVSGEGSAIKLFVKDGKLVFDLEGRKMKARPTGVDSFVLSMHGMQFPVVFLRDGAGDVSAMHMSYRMIKRAPAKEEQAVAD